MTSAATGEEQRTVSVLVVEGSAGGRRILSELLEADRQIAVAGAVADCDAAMRFLDGQRPDVVLIGAEMPATDGFETTRRIMETRPVPIVLAAVAATANDTIFRSLEAGAVACVDYPAGGAGHPADAAASHLLQTLKLMSEVKVVRRWASARSRGSAPASDTDPGVNGLRTRVIGIGASTGGPVVLQTILAALPADFAAPILVVQHIARGFLPGMAQWLRQTSGLRVQIAGHGMVPQPGHVYLAPDDFQMGLDGDGSIVLAGGDRGGGVTPSVAFLFDSLAGVLGPRAIGVLLTGMGKDGAAELKRMKNRGAVTIAQDKETSVVHGMPGEAIAIGAATHVLPADRIAGALVALAGTRSCA
jgi:two-component system chemotaxis response regulator CheB